MPAGSRRICVAEAYSHATSLRVSSRCARTVSLANVLSSVFAGKVRVAVVVVALSNTRYSYDGPAKPVSLGTEIFRLAVPVAPKSQPFAATAKPCCMTNPSPASAAVVGSLVRSTWFNLPRRIWPRLLKSKNSRWLPFARLIGLRTKTSIEYSTIPSALGAASWTSVITLLRESFGSSTPLAVPRSFSYWPTEPKLRPPNVGDCERAGSQVTLVILAWARDGARANAATMATAMVLMDGLLSAEHAFVLAGEAELQGAKDGSRAVCVPAALPPLTAAQRCAAHKTKVKSWRVRRVGAARQPTGTACARLLLLA